MGAGKLIFPRGNMRNGDCWTFVSAVCFTGELITLNELEDAQLYPLIFTIILVRLLKKLENILHILNSAADSSNFKQNKNWKNNWGEDVGGTQSYPGTPWVTHKCFFHSANHDRCTCTWVWRRCPGSWEIANNWKPKAADQKRQTRKET